MRTNKGTDAAATEDDGLHTQFNTEDFEVEWSKFTDAMDKYRDWFGNFTSEVEVEDGEDTPYIWEPHNHSEALSVFHLYNSVEFETDDAEKLRVFFERCHNYRKKSTKIEKDIKKKVMKNKDITELQTELIALQDINLEIRTKVVIPILKLIHQIEERLALLQEPILLKSLSKQ